MPYANSAAVSRPEIKAFLEQAREAEKGLIAEKVLGVYQSPNMTGRYPRYKLEKGELLNVELETERAPHGAYKRVSRSWEWDTYDCKDRGMEGAIDDTQQAEMAMFFDVEATEAKLVRRNVALSYERRVADLVMSSGNSGFNAANSAVAYTEANIATIDLARDIQTAKRYLEARGVNPDDVSVVLAREVWDRLRRSTKLLSYVFGNTNNMGNQKISLQVAADALEVKEILVSGRHYNGGKKGQSASLSAIWGTSTVLVANLAAGDFNNGGIGRTITWTEDASGLYVAETYRDEKTREDIVRVRQNTAEKIIDTNEGYLITTQWA
jgi:hypothetical protein